MTERKSRFGDRSAMPEDPALRVLALRPRGEAKDPAAPITYPGRLAAQDQQGLVARLQQAREETAAAQEKFEKERTERERERTEGLLLLRLDPESIGLTEFANRHELSLLATDEKLKSLKPDGMTLTMNVGLALESGGLVALLGGAKMDTGLEISFSWGSVSE